MGEIIQEKTCNKCSAWAMQINNILSLWFNRFWICGWEPFWGRNQLSSFSVCLLLVQILNLESEVISLLFS